MISKFNGILIMNIIIYKIKLKIINISNIYKGIQHYLKVATLPILPLYIPLLYFIYILINIFFVSQF